MGLIESSKVYSGRELETIFFRPTFTGQSAQDLGIRVLYNMPMPTTIHLWSPASNVLKPYQTGWQGGESAVKEQKTIDMKKVKAETAFSASDYFSMVFELITNRADVNMEDLTGTELEAAETELFKKAMAESIRMTMWLGDTDSDTPFNTFDGILKSAMAAANDATHTGATLVGNVDDIALVLESLWSGANEELKALKADGQLAYFVTSNLYNEYEKYLDSKDLDVTYRERVDGRNELYYHGIPVIDMCISSGIREFAEYPARICMLTDRRNLVLAVNTADFPGTEVRMWYNPDEMENRQRAVFLAGADIIDPKLVAMAFEP